MSTAFAELAVRLRDLGLKVCRTGTDSLEVDGDQSQITPELARLLGEHRGEYLRLLRNPDEPATATAKQSEPGGCPLCGFDHVRDCVWCGGTRIEVADMTGLGSIHPWCPAYGHADGWRSTYGEHLICATCYPPATDEVVAARLTYTPSGEVVAEPNRPRT